MDRYLALTFLNLKSAIDMDLASTCWMLIIYHLNMLTLEE